MLSRALRLLDERAKRGEPLGVAVIGAGAFSTMLLGQLRRLDGVRLCGVGDLVPARAVEALDRAGWPTDRRPAVTGDAASLVTASGVEVVVEATGDALAGTAHALAAVEAGRHVVMVTVEADVLAGAALADRARRAGVVYSLAYGDQPALVCELVDWARAAGFEPVCAGKGTKYLPEYVSVTPDDVWDHYGLTAEQVERGRFSTPMFTSFLDGTKSAIEMASVCNATGLVPQEEGLGFPPAGASDLARVCIPRDAGGELGRRGTVEVASSLRRDGTPVPDDLRWGVFVTFEAPSDYVAECFRAYGLATDTSGRYAALWRPYHLIGLEASVSVLAAGLLGEPTGTPQAHRAEVAAVTKRALAAGETLDGEGGYTVYGTLVPAARARDERLLPIGLARGAVVRRNVEAGRALRDDDVEPIRDSAAASLRAELAG